MRRVIFLMTGPGHLPNLVVALHTLRRYYDGPVDVFSWEESMSVVKQIRRDSRIGIDIIPWTPLYHGHSDTYVDKTRLIQSMPTGDEVLFLDADISIHGKLDPLFDCISTHGCVTTQFNDWISTGSTISGRLRSLLQFPEIDKTLIDTLLSRAWPSVNTGIFGGAPDSPVFPLWHEWTYAVRQTFIPDEKTMHVLTAKFGPTKEIAVAGGGRWNCSPKFQPANLADEDVRIWHFHGDSNLRPSKSQRGFDMWSGLYQQVMSLNLGGIRDWVHGIKNKHLQQLLSEGLL